MSKKKNTSEKYFYTSKEAEKIGYEYENLPIPPVNSEKADKFVDFLRSMGHNVEKQIFWNLVPSYYWIPKKEQGGLKLVFCVEDYSHSDIEGNPYCYNFDPVTGNEILE